MTSVLASHCLSLLGKAENQALALVFGLERLTVEFNHILDMINHILDAQENLLNNLCVVFELIIPEI